MSPPPQDFVGDLQWRGLVHQCTDEAGLRKHLSEAPRKVYIGFDPTADSLTIGNLVPIMLLAFAQRAGHAPVVVAGGGTGLIGDPSGKSAERELRTPEQVAANVEAQKRIYSRVLDFSASLPNRAVIVNNLDWLGKLSYLEALRDIGKHFSVNMMIQKESVKERLHNRDQGISYTEFSYMILQAYDFLHLFQKHGVTIQMGASDQWGNIVAGTDQIRRHVGEEFQARFPHEHWTRDPKTGEQVFKGTEAGREFLEHRRAFGLTTSLLTKADGTKYGKTESGTIWLTADRTSPYTFYQFLLNIPDEDAERFLKTFTFLSQEQIAAIMVQQKTSPGLRVAQREVARQVTRMLHGDDELRLAECATAALFSGDVADLPQTLLDEVFASCPSSAHPRSQLEGDGLPLLDLLATTICKSKSEARQSLTEGAIAVNGVKAGPTDRLTAAKLLHNSVILLRRGKKTWHVTRWS